MPTGQSHERLISADFDDAGNLLNVSVEDCRCMIGTNHDGDGNEIDDWQDLEDESSTLSVYDAADIWRSHGEDSDYQFGYSEDELRTAADES